MKKFMRQLLALTLAIVCLCPVITAAVAPSSVAAVEIMPVRAAGFFGRLVSSLFKKDDPEGEGNKSGSTMIFPDAKDGYVSPVDFDALRSQNDEIYAWIEIEGTSVSYPILRSTTDNAFYLTHDSLKKKSSKGAIFTEDYNDYLFNDPMTVIYGHTTRDGTLFGKLQENYSSPEYFEAHRTIKIYQPHCEYTYKIFAAVPFSNEHILYYYNFLLQSDFDLFYEKIFTTRSLIANVDKDVTIGMKDHVIALSTCIASDRSKRFLVLAVRETDNK